MRSQDDKRPQSFLEWMGFREVPDWLKARPMGAALGVLLTLSIPLLFLFAIGAAFAVMWHTVIHGFGSGDAGPSLGAGALIAALLGAPFLIWSTVLRHRTVEFQKEGHITERISKAVEQLGAEKTVSETVRSISHTADGETETRFEIFQDANHRSYDTHFGDGFHYGDWEQRERTVPNIEVRIGGLLSLERIAQDSTRYDKGRDHVRVMEILCAYVRENAPNDVKELHLVDRDFQNTRPPRIDIQIAITIISRRSKPQIIIEHEELYRLDLRNCDFTRASLEGANLVGALFDSSCLDFANLDRANLTAARLRNCSLTCCSFHFAKINGTIFDSSSTSSSALTWSAFTPEGFISASFVGCDFSGFFLNKECLLPPCTIGTSDTLIPPFVEGQRVWLKSIDVHHLSKSSGKYDPKIELFAGAKSAEEIRSSIYKYWSPYTKLDGANEQFFKKFREDFDLLTWPHVDKK